MASNPFSRAIRDHYFGEREDLLIDRDGDETREHQIEDWYSGDHRDGPNELSKLSLSNQSF